MSGPYIFAVLRRHWFTVFIVFVSGLLATGGYFMLAPRTYTSRVALTVSPVNNAQAATDFNSTASYLLPVLGELARSNELLGRVHSKVPGSLRVSKLQSVFVVDIVPNSYLLRITASDPNPKRAQQLAQAVADVMPDFNPSSSLLNLTVVSAAPLPTKPDTPDPVLTIPVGAAASLVAALVAALIMHQIRPRIVSATEVESLTGLPMIGSLSGWGKKGKLHSRQRAARQIAARLVGELPRVQKMLITVAPVSGSGLPGFTRLLANALTERGLIADVIATDGSAPKQAQTLGGDAENASASPSATSLDSATVPLRVLPLGSKPHPSAAALAGITAPTSADSPRVQVVLAPGPGIDDSPTSSLLAQGGLLILVDRFRQYSPQQIVEAVDVNQAAGVRIIGYVAG